MRNFVARTTPWGTIQTGRRFERLPVIEQEAIIAHEQGHIHHRHVWKRFLWIVSLGAFRNTNAFFKMLEDQEYEADRYAADRGHAAGLTFYLRRFHPHVESPGYPSNAKRIEALNG